MPGVNIASAAERTDAECKEAIQEAKEYVAYNSKLLRRVNAHGGTLRAIADRRNEVNSLVFAHAWNWNIVYYLAPENGGNVLPDCVAQGKAKSKQLRKTREVWCATRKVFVTKYPQDEESDRRAGEVMGCL